MYKCKYCNKEFFFEGQLKRHVLFRHPSEPEDSDLYNQIRGEVEEELQQTSWIASQTRTYTPRIWSNEYLGRFVSPNVIVNTTEDLSIAWSSEGHRITADTTA